MFTDEKRAQVHDEIRHHDQALFAHILTPDLFFQAATLCGLSIVCSPLNLINLVWLAVSAARNPEQSFACLLGLSLKTLQDNDSFSASPLKQLIDNAKQQRRKTNRHDPRGGAADRVSAAAFAKARQKMPSEFWVALFVLLAEQFHRLYDAVVRWRHFRLLAVDGSRINLPDYPALRNHFGTAKNSFGSHNAQAQLVMLQLPLVRLPYAYALAPVQRGEVSLARQLLHGLRPEDLVLLDAGFLSYGLLWQIHYQGACFVVRLHKQLNMKVIQQLGSKNDQLVSWQPKDSRGQWRKEKLPRSIVLRLLTYKARGFRPMQLLTDVLSPAEVSVEQFWGLSLAQEGEVLTKGLYNYRWEIETTYLELKVQQRLEGGLRSRTAEGIYYEVAGHVLYYLLVRWLLVEAAAKAGLSPLRLSFKEARREIEVMGPAALTASAGWLSAVLRPRLVERMASHVVVERPGRQSPRSKKDRKASKRRADRRAKRAAKTRQARRGAEQKKAKQRQWFGEGWDLAGPTTPAGPRSQG